MNILKLSKAVMSMIGIVFIPLLFGALFLEVCTIFLIMVSVISVICLTVIMYDEVDKD